MDLRFLKSNRFWVLIIGAVALFLKQEGIIDEAVFALIGTISAGFIGIRTADRFAEQQNEVIELTGEQIAEATKEV